MSLFINIQIDSLLNITNMSKPTESGKRYIPLTDNILMEYVYVADRFVAGESQLNEDILTSNGEGTYGDSAICNYCITGNRYTNEKYFVNNAASVPLTNNTLLNTVLPTKKDSTMWVRTQQVNGLYYTSVDERWSDIESGEGDIMKQPDIEHEYIPYDILRIYFRSNYHSEYDGFIFNLYTKNHSGEYINLLCAIHTNYDDYKMLAEPLWFADKVYVNYIEFRVPSTAYLSTDKSNTGSMNHNYNNTQYQRRYPFENSLAYHLSEHGYYQNPSIGIDLHAIVGYEEKKGFEVIKTRALTSTLFPNKDSYDNLKACILPDVNGGDFYTLYTYYENDIHHPLYDPNSLYDYLCRFDTTFTLAHTLTVTEKYNVPNEGNEPNVTLVDSQIPITYIQTWEMLVNARDNHESPLIKFRPILEHTEGLVKATIDYTVRITNNRDNTTIIKTASANIINPQRFGANMVAIDLSEGMTENHIYNRVEVGAKINVSTINRPIGAVTNSDTPIIQVNKYVTSSFIDRRNIRVRVSPVTVENIE